MERHTEFEDFFTTFEPVLRRALVAGYGGDLGREATAEALTHAWAHWERVADLANRRGYVFRVGERWARRRRTRDSGRPLFPSSDSAADKRFEPGLGPALGRLTTRQRQSLVLVHGMGLTHAEAASLLGIRRTSVQNHVERGLTALRHDLGVEP